ncbi:MAG: hypothetical protein L0Y71_09400 [Gemmataceae bacterium]|nr:hypothetical protein [Gemmataceae bacterium]
MVRQPVRLALLLGAITALAVSPARADHCSAPCPTTTRTIKVTECVPETYTVKRTVYKVECRQETVDGFRCETVQVPKERTVTCVKRVPCYKDEVRKVCHKVTVYEDREVCKKVWRTCEETVMQKRLKCLGHWECREVCGGGLFGGHGRNNSCDPCSDPCPRTRNVWVFCPEYECCPVKVCKRVRVDEKCIVKVPVCRTEWREEKVKVCTYQCVTEQKVERYTVCETRKVPCKITRTVRVCVPHEETVTCTRMVARTVERQVECPVPCCDPCARPSLCDRLRDAFSSRCNAGCDRGCH